MTGASNKDTPERRPWCWDREKVHVCDPVECEELGRCWWDDPSTMLTDDSKHGLLET